MELAYTAEHGCMAKIGELWLGRSGFDAFSDQS
jgi:hypothetical protein